MGLTNMMKNKIDFNTYWQKEFSEFLPFCHSLKYNYPDRWFRIHSLPNSKRYADTKDEYQTIINRQNQLFDTVIGERTNIMLVFAICTYDVTNENYAKIIDYKEFRKIKTINLSQTEPENYEDNIFLDIYVKYTRWHKNEYNKILKAIADDKVRFLFVCPSKNRIIGPYDGGVDVIMENEVARDKMKIKYKNWLSNREDGW
ncbi:hypothetical protein MNBD_GAMMA01-192 [hydrothermal vent metagenome]|uniref:DUF3885 domain-containing protein n=1 Tax=hydrothermal vent metagenome TaxID=652676 RepID=A0A3B0VI27_9ZZZZ